MGRLSFHVAGESHGPALVLLLTGMPAGVPVPEHRIARWLELRRSVAGRGLRAPAEPDHWEILAGVHRGKTNGGPLALSLGNRDRSGRSRTAAGELLELTFPRPGHGDLAGALKWGLADATPVAELASARLTAAYTLMGAWCQELLEVAGCLSLARTTRIGPVSDRTREWRKGARLGPVIERVESSPVLFLDGARAARAAAEIAAAREAGDTVGGEFEVVVAPVWPGLGSPQPLEARLDSRLAGMVAGIPGVVAVSLGDGAGAGRQRGSAYHPPLGHDASRGYRYGRNRSGGVEAGMTNGEPLVVRGVMKPVPSLAAPRPSASLADGSPGSAPAVRGDVCAAPAAAVVARALVAYVLADELLLRAGGETLDVLRQQH